MLTVRHKVQNSEVDLDVFKDVFLDKTVDTFIEVMCNINNYDVENYLHGIDLNHVMLSKLLLLGIMRRSWSKLFDANNFDKNNSSKLAHLIKDMSMDRFDVKDMVRKEIISTETPYDDPYPHVAVVQTLNDLDIYNWVLDWALVKDWQEYRRPTTLPIMDEFESIPQKRLLFALSYEAAYYAVTTTRYWMVNDYDGRYMPSGPSYRIANNSQDDWLLRQIREHHHPENTPKPSDQFPSTNTLLLFSESDYVSFVMGATESYDQFDFKRDLRVNRHFESEFM